MRAAPDVELTLATALVDYRRDGIARGYHLDLTIEQVRASNAARKQCEAAARAFLELYLPSCHSPARQLHLELRKILERVLDDPCVVLGISPVYSELRHKISLLQAMERSKAGPGKEAV